MRFASEHVVTVAKDDAETDDASGPDRFGVDGESELNGGFGRYLDGIGVAIVDADVDGVIARYEINGECPWERVL